MAPEDATTIRRAAVILDTCAQDLYERACLTSRDKRAMNKLLERRTKFTRISRELLEVTGLIGTRTP